MENLDTPLSAGEDALSVRGSCFPDESCGVKRSGLRVRTFMQAENMMKRQPLRSGAGPAKVGYSVRSDCAGSIEAARRAGINPANVAASARATTAAAIRPGATPSIS